MNNAVLIVPANERGRGGGHLGRSLLTLRALSAKGREAFLWVPEYLKDDFLLRFKEFFDSLARNRIISREKELFDHDWDFIVIDRFRTSVREFAFWSALAPLVGIDEGGPCRNRFDFLIDLLPSVTKIEPNIYAPALLPMPKSRRPKVSRYGEGLAGPFRVLISFGAEDSSGLGPAAARELSRLKRELEITLISPLHPCDSGGGANNISGVKVMGKIPNLRESLAEYDLLITHFGLGAFEAVYARLPVLLISPTAYHEKLSRNAGFLSLGHGGVRRIKDHAFDRDFFEALNKKGGEIARRFGLEEDQEEDISSFVPALTIRSPKRCPVCERNTRDFPLAPVLARSAEQSYRRCPFCGTIYLSRLKPPPIEYGKDYFFDLYEKQYGKTYLEDFPNLVEAGKRRVAIVKALSAGKLQKPCLLDIGCAYGPFLAAAAECGFSPVGIDPVEDAVSYVKEELGFPAWFGFFPSGLPEEFRQQPVAANEAGGGFFDAICLWYVIEHFQEPGKMLREINSLLKSGGVLAFSTPSFSGISGRKNLKTFLKNSPPDHWTVWRPKSCKKIFKQYGFHLRKIVVTGHHPERFPFVGRFVSDTKKGPLYRLLFFISRFLRLGDTFEVYGVKRD